MAFILTALLFVIFLGVVASLYTEGMWGNAIRLVNVVTAALLATNFYEPVTTWLEGMSDTFKNYTYMLDFLTLWVLFAIFMAILRGITDKVSTVKVKFLGIADQIGSVVFACVVALVVVGYATFTLHTAPLSQNFLFGGFQPQKKMMLGLGPDRMWLRFTRSVSNGAFSRSPVTAFDAHGQFIDKYEVRRAAIGAHVQKTGSIQIN